MRSDGAYLLPASAGQDERLKELADVPAGKQTRAEDSFKLKA